MFTDILTQIAGGTSSVTFIMALTEMLKPFIANTAYYPWVALLIGIVLNLLVAFALVPLTYANLLSAILIGALASFIASGVYDKVTGGNTPPAP